MEVPVVATSGERAAWLEQVRTDLINGWDETLLDQYLAEMDAKVKPRASISLPADAESHQRRLRKGTMLELATSRSLKFSIDRGSASCQVNGMTWQMDIDVAERLRMFNDRKPHSINALAPTSDLRVSAMVGVMVMKGVLRRVEEPQN
jgi:hypothetical protein